MLYDMGGCDISIGSNPNGQNVRSEDSRQVARYGKPFDKNLSISESGCLIWVGAKDKDGYGVRGSRIGEKRAHRYAYVSKNGPIPSGQVVRHTCDTPACCEPSHLVLGTHAQNIQDKVARNRQARGQDAGRAKLTEEMVREIRALYASGKTQTQIASVFPVTQSSVSLIVSRKQWAHI